MTLEIVTDTSKLLSTCAKIEDLTDPAYRDLGKQMLEAMKASEGIGLAAPQIGQNIQLIVVLGGLEGAPYADDMILANPKITKRSTVKESKNEGCLSLPGYRTKIRRSWSVTVEAWDVNLGMNIVFESRELHARCIQHEVDHLYGRLIK